MAKTDYNALNFWRGRVGGKIYKVQMGKQVILEYVQPANPNTEAQRLVRAKEKVIGSLAGRLRYVLRIGMKPYARELHSPTAGAFQKVNYASILRGTTPDTLAVIPDKMVLSKGNRLKVLFDNSIQQTTPGKLGITYNDPYASSYPELHDDKVYVAVYCPDMDAAIMGEPASRGAGTLRVDIPSAWSGLDVHVYGFVASKDGRDVSDSEYIGHVTLN